MAPTPVIGEAIKALVGIQPPGRGRLWLPSPVLGRGALSSHVGGTRVWCKIVARIGSPLPSRRERYRPLVGAGLALAGAA